MCRSVTTSIQISRRLATVLCGLGCLAFPRVSSAHITLTAPIDWIKTNSAGDPQKITPCGVAAGATVPMPTNKVNVVTVGDKLTVTWTETVPHDGHFRISLAMSRDELLDPATVNNSNGTAASAAISTAYPVLADNLFPHLASDIKPPATSKDYSYTVTIPNMPCTKCTLQVLQFMANHPLDPSYFYHQCADMQIMAGPGVDAGAAGGTSGGGSAGTSGGGGRAGTSGAGGRAGTSGAGGRAGTSGSAGAGNAGGTGAGNEGGTGTGSAGSTGSGSAGSPGSGIAGTTGTGNSGGVGTAGVTGTGGGATGVGGTTGSGGSDGGSTGCSCRMAAGRPAAGLAGFGLCAVALLLGRRARRARRR